MVIYNNMAAMSVLNESNRQNNKLSNSMEKLASGLKVRHAGDDASAYSISEKMRVQIRALNQCGRGGHAEPNGDFDYYKGIGVEICQRHIQ